MPRSIGGGLILPRLFISHSSKDDLAAEAMRVHLVQRGWHRKEIFLDFSVEGISAHAKWKASLAEANSGANAFLCLASPEWLASKESQVERRVAETLRDLNRPQSRAVFVAILRDLTLDDLRAEGFGEDQIVDLSAAGESTLIRAELPGRSGQSGRYDDIKLNTQALEKIERSLRLIGIAPESFEWRPRDPTRPSPYPGLEAFTEYDAGVFFGRESRLADALGIIDGLRRRDGSRVFTIIAPSGVGKSSFLRAGLWPRLGRQSGIAPLVILRPGAGIMSGREGGLIHLLAEWFRRAGQTVAAGDLRAQFAGRSTQEGLAFVFNEAAHAAGEGCTLILAIDQAEELFDTTDQTKATEAKEFLNALLALLAMPPAGVDFLVIFTIRSDSYDPLAAALARASDTAEKLGRARRQALQETSLTLLPLAATAYRDVIRRPAQVALKTDREIFDPALVDDLVDTFTGADALPLLAMTVEQLFAEYGPRRHITRADYKALYGTHARAKGSVSRALSEAYRIAGAAGNNDTLKRLLIPALATWDPTAGEGGAARRRIAIRATLLDDDPDLTRLADAMASPQARLLTRGMGEAGPTLEVAHEALLRVQPVRDWIMEFSADLKLRDEIEREASEWQKAETRLIAAREQMEEPNQLKVLQEQLDSAIAARHGPRLEVGTRLIRNPSFARLLGSNERSYLDVCRAYETEQIDKRNRARMFELTTMNTIPSYLLNNFSELLDWNPAFELIFPTNRFYRNMSVKEFVDCLDNSSEVKRRGLEWAESTVPLDTLDVQEIRYTSPVYGKMRFTKISSRVVHPITEDTSGWIVTLNVNDAERWQVYKNDLERTYEEQTLISLYALSAERILGRFPGYAAIVDAHLQGMHDARRVLDLGSGPGFLAAKLLAAGVSVTSIDINDAMIEVTRRRCGAFPGFSAVKANVERLHAPNEFYDMTKIGISRLYDGACMLNLYQWLHDPPAVLQRLVQEELLSPGARVTISLLCGKHEIEELFLALSHLKQVEQVRRAARNQSFDLWEPEDFDRFSTVMRQFIARGIARLTPDVVAGHLNAAGYRVVDQRRVGYEIDGQRFDGFPFLIAEAPRG